MTTFIRNQWFNLTALLLLLISALSLYPLDNRPEAPGSDKTHHFVAYAALAFPTALRKPKRWRIIILYFTLYSGLIELIQPTLIAMGNGRIS